jgi:hypothetical protein
MLLPPALTSSVPINRSEPLIDISRVGACSVTKGKPLPPVTTRGFRAARSGDPSKLLAHATCFSVGIGRIGPSRFSTFQGVSLLPLWLPYA